MVFWVVGLLVLLGVVSCGMQGREDLEDSDED